jgi:hypothetical protein
MYNFIKVQIKIYFILAILIFSITITLHYAYGAESDLESGVKIIADNLQSSITSTLNQPLKIAILPFSWDNDNQWALCRVITELIYTHTSQMKELTLIDRNTVMQAMANLKIGIKKGILSDEDAAKLRTQM